MYSNIGSTISRRNELWTLFSPLDLNRKIPYAYYTKRSRLKDEKVEYSIFLATKDLIVEESRYYLTDGSTVLVTRDSTSAL